MERRWQPALGSDQRDSSRGQEQRGNRRAQEGRARLAALPGSMVERARPLGLLFTCTHVCAGHARASHRGQCTRHCRFQVLHQQRRSVRPAVEFSNIDEYVAAIKELPDPDPPEAQEEIGEGVPERVTALEAQVAELMKRVQKLEE